MTTTEPVVEACNNFWRAWREGDPRGLFQLWDSSDPACSYVAADQPTRLLGGDAVRSYIEQRLDTYQQVRMRPRDVHARRLSPSLGTAFAVVDWACQGDPGSLPIGGTVRVSAVLRNSDTGWRVCHYAEAPLAPLVELRHFYQQIAADGHEGLT